MKIKHGNKFMNVEGIHGYHVYEEIWRAAVVVRHKGGLNFVVAKKLPGFIFITVGY